MLGTMKYKVVLMFAFVLFACAPALAQKKPAEKKPAENPAAVVVTEPAAPAKKKAPRMTVTAESSEVAKETGEGIVLSDDPYSGASDAEPELGASDEEKGNRKRAAAAETEGQSDRPRAGGSKIPQHRPVVKRPVVNRPSVKRPKRIGS